MKALRTKGKYAVTDSLTDDTTDLPKTTESVRILFGKESYLLIDVYDDTHVRLSAGNTNGQVVASSGENDSNGLFVSIIE